MNPRNALNAVVGVPPLFVTKDPFQLLAKVMSNVWSYEPLVTPKGKPANEGSCVAGAAVPVFGLAVGAWMCAAVVPASKPWNWTCTRIVIADAFIVTVVNPVPGEPFGGDSLGPSRFAVNTKICACPAAAKVNKAPITRATRI